ncbi:MAG: septum formation initiator family protein [Pseudomonadota bacterium]
MSRLGSTIFGWTQIDWAQLATPCISIVIVAALAVFGHSGLYGGHGLAALQDAREREAEMQADLAALRAERERLANLVDRLGPNNLDLDLLDERARRVLGYTRGDELIIR